MSTIDLGVLQPVSWVAAAIGVCVAAFYYALNLRETTRNRRAALTNTIMQTIFSEEGARRWIDLVNMQWSDMDDYRKKYDSDVNPENFADRWSFFGMLDVLGYQYKAGLVDLETLYELNWSPVIMMWVQFSPVIKMYRKSDYGADTYANFELLAKELWKIKMRRDPEWKEHMGGGYSKEEIERAFSP